MPQNEAGTRIEPPVSLPSARLTWCVASATAEPPLEPPETSAGSHGLRLVPMPWLTEVMPHANSWVCVLPTRIAPAARARRSTSASAAGTCSRNIVEP